MDGILGLFLLLSIISLGVLLSTTIIAKMNRGE